MENWLHHLRADPTEWMLLSNPWTKFRTMTDLLDQPIDALDVQATRDACLESETVQALLD